MNQSTIHPPHHNHRPSLSRPKDIDILILGAGWTSQFLIPLLEKQIIPWAATTTTGRDNTIKFVFDSDSPDKTPFQTLPHAKTILVTFPLKGKGQSAKLVRFYRETHAMMVPNWIQLGSTGIFVNDENWSSCESEYDLSNARAVAEDELRELGGCVLNLAGLYGKNRDPKNWVGKVAKDKEMLKCKKSLHLIHGNDVARAVLAVHRRFTQGERWIVTDLHIYDWWDLIWSWADELAAKWSPPTNQTQSQTQTTGMMGATMAYMGLSMNSPNLDAQRPQYRKWIAECMMEEKVRALPRSPEILGRRLDARDFWKSMGITPSEVLKR